MKKLKLTLILLIVLSGYLIGQNKLNFSLEVSPNLSQISKYENGFYSSHKLSFNLGLTAERKIAQNTAFTGSLTFLNTGSKKKEDNNPKKRTIGLNYIIASIGAKQYFGRFFISTDIGLGIFWFSSEKDHYDDRIDVTINFVPYQAEVSSFSISYLLNLGYEFKFKQKTFYTGLKSYVIFESYRNGPQENKSYPYGIGALLGIKL